MFRVEVEHLEMGADHPFGVMRRHEDVAHFPDDKVNLWMSFKGKDRCDSVDFVSR